MTKKEKLRKEFYETRMDSDAAWGAYIAATQSTEAGSELRILALKAYYKASKAHQAADDALVAEITKDR